MTNLRRVLPPPRRRPSLVTIAVRWRIELLLGTAIGLWVGLLGWLPLTVAAGAVAVALAVNPSLRRGAARVLRAVIVPHRVRSGLLQSGVTDRSGRLPWLVRAYSRGETVFVHVWLRAGTTTGDLRRARAVLRAACGAADVDVHHHPTRHDRAVIVVFRPRWGWFGK
ncbi:hypothetical protein [Labedaea rhizosphaerae]|uniref:Uncharacterized protein n=1 Tax=Labedaea rhizosphaerae TaxID=598644 RepID=A0A4V3CZI8_LABRH|nr:hypothetical protein [Labedaea rhizosphaerae]TDP98178.1 hypothetical protein EV186_1031159 [Labedaea rhizosphaerae]